MGKTRMVEIAMGHRMRHGGKAFESVVCRGRVRAEMFGPCLAVHTARAVDHRHGGLRVIPGFSVTHVPTGRSLGNPMATITAARRLARAVVRSGIDLTQFSEKKGGAPSTDAVRLLELVLSHTKALHFRTKDGVVVGGAR